MDERERVWSAKVWRINAAIDMPELAPEAVQVTIMDTDPLERFRQLLHQSLGLVREQMARETDDAQGEVTKRTQMAGIWDRMFANVPGDQIFLLATARQHDRRAHVRNLAFASEGPAGRKWLVSKIAYQEGQPVCWSIALDTEKGKSITVQLRNDNRLNLNECFDEIVGPS